ncbi:unnamed protein product [Cladocopium goreaui]|uniref:Uncharacterized protein n=1 Tax=Cladocopium goreaui TaxID=2562237 RepID=A0A9P1FSX0_9DINO|nr:unnamed protein product [Cladocopium goreaui]
MATNANQSQKLDMLMRRLYAIGAPKAGMKVCALLLVITCMGGGWILEQPRSSQLIWLPRVRATFRMLPKVFQASWWMALYGGLTPKRHIAYSNTKTIQLLDLGVLLKEVREKLSKHGCQSTRSYQNKGKKVFAGTQFLKQTQTYPPRFAKRVTKYYKRFCTQGNGHFPPEADDGVLTSFQILALLQEQTENDLWLDAQLMESFMYLRGSKSLELGELRQVLPSSIPLP